eukprot:3941941-Rhodomonas_salina.5
MRSLSTAHSVASIAAYASSVPCIAYAVRRRIGRQPSLSLSLPPQLARRFFFCPRHTLAQYRASDSTIH